MNNSNRLLKIIMAVIILLTGLLPESLAFGTYPSDLDLMVVSQNQIRLLWTDNLSDEAGYKVDRKMDAGDFSEITSVAANNTSYTDYSVTSGHNYTYRIRSYTSAGIYNIHTEEVSVSTSNIIMPSSLIVKPYSSSRLDLVWSYPESKSYDTVVERRASGSSTWESIATVEKGSSNYSDSNLAPNTSYFYRVKAIAGPHVFSATYPNDSIGMSAYTMFDPPSEFYGFASAPDQIYVLWNDIQYEASYTIERKTGSTGTYQTVGNVPANRTYWLDTTVTPNTRYTYRLKGVNGINISDYTQEVMVASIHLEEPSGLTAASTSADKVELNWKDNSESESGFEIWRRVGNDSNWALYSTVGRNITYFTDEDLDPDKQYSYRVRAIVSHSYIYSAFTPPVSAWTIAVQPPQELKATIVTPTEVILGWKDCSNNESGFTIERKTGEDGEWGEIGTVSADTVQFDDRNVKENVQYYYRVKALDNTYYNSASYSEEIEVVTGLPKAPSNLELTPVSSSLVRLKWKDNSDNESGFIIERRSFNGVVYSEIARTDANETTYLNDGMPASVRYYYRIKAYNRTGSSSYSNEAYSAAKQKVVYTDLKNDGDKIVIEDLASRGIFKNKEGGLFRPNDKMTRGELMYILVKAFGLNLNVSGSFADVKRGSPYYNEIMIADKAGIIARNGSKYFYPNGFLTREDLAVFITRTMKAVDKPLESFDESILEQFGDVDKVSQSSLSSIISVVGEKILRGKISGNEFLIAPKSIVTRKEAALVISRVIDR